MINNFVEGESLRYTTAGYTAVTERAHIRLHD